MALSKRYWMQILPLKAWIRCEVDSAGLSSDEEGTSRRCPAAPRHHRKPSAFPLRPSVEESLKAHEASPSQCHRAILP